VIGTFSEQPNMLDLTCAGMSSSPALRDARRTRSSHRETGNHAQSLMQIVTQKAYEDPEPHLRLCAPRAPLGPADQRESRFGDTVTRRFCRQAYENDASCSYCAEWD
jgi:hypothetical protein